MLGQLVAAQFDLESAIAELERSGAPTDAVRSSMQMLGDLQRQIGTATPELLNALRGEIAAGANAGRAIAQQSRAAASGDSADDLLAATTARTRATVQRIGEDLFERKIFDPYLQFDSEAEERAYRQREAERQEYIRRELAKGTPEGTLNAITATREQIEDAGAHGADRSPEFARLLNEARADEESLRSAIPREATPTTSQPGTTPAAQKEEDGLGELLAALRDAGVVAAETVDANPTHGLTVARTATPVREV